jgi:hypothetical protein
VSRGLMIVGFGTRKARSGELRRVPIAPEFLCPMYAERMPRNPEVG